MPLVLLCALLVVSGCAGRRGPIAAAPPPEFEAVASTAEASVPVAPQPEPAPAAEPVDDVAEVEEDTPPAPPAPPAPPPRRSVAILFNDSVPDYAEVVDQLAEMLPPERYRLTLANVDAEGLASTLEPLRGQKGLFVVAVGLPAARLARDELGAPVVFAQVFNYDELLVEGRAVKGVATVVPLDLQLADWKKLDPGLARIGLIVSPSHSYLIDEARSAAESNALVLQHAVSSSDQETLYLFKRLAPQIDGLWLVPDDRILSPTVLRELMSYALSHGVRVSVFSESLLPWGALLSATSTTSDVARTVRQVLDRMIAGEQVPMLTPLSELAAKINPEVAARMGIELPARNSWIVRSEH